MLDLLDVELTRELDLSCVDTDNKGNINLEVMLVLAKFKSKQDSDSS